MYLVLIIIIVLVTELRHTLQQPFRDTELLFQNLELCLILPQCLGLTMLSLTCQKCECGHLDVMQHTNSGSSWCVAKFNPAIRYAYASCIFINCRFACATYNHQSGNTTLSTSNLTRESAYVTISGCSWT